jgi:hypothetical protein
MQFKKIIAVYSEIKKTYKYTVWDSRWRLLFTSIFWGFLFDPEDEDNIRLRNVG